MCRVTTEICNNLEICVNNLTSTVIQRGRFTLPAQRTASLIVCYTCFEEILLFTQVHHFRHPLERVVHTSKLLRQAQLC